jgi:peptidoglycan hydrolase-like protein with peptidoglycan-binding domain
VIIALAAGAAAVLWFTGWFQPKDDATTDDAAPASISTAAIEQRDLVEYAELDGELGYDASASFTAGGAGVITAIAEVGDTLGRGDTAFELAGEPVVVLYGDIPPYRELSDGVDDGPDVEQLERNLVAMGYDPDHEIAIDQEFDWATDNAVEAWEVDLGRDEDGVVALSDWVAASGPVLVTELLLSKGRMANSDVPVLAGDVISEVLDVFAETEGTLTVVPTAGDPIEQGAVLYEVESTAVPVLTGTDQLVRDLSTETSNGADVRRLEQALADLGHDAGGDLAVDNHFDEATAEALAEWESDLGVDDDGVAQPGQYLVVPSGYQVSETHAARGDAMAEGQHLLELTRSTRVVTARLELDRRDLVRRGARVEVELPDGSMVRGHVVDVGTVATRPEGDPDADPTLEMLVVVNAADLAEGLTGTPVEVLLEDQVAEGVLAVPVTALVALREGGYAVEVVDGATTRLVGVETGMFADGYVEITGEGLAPGLEVVIPA